MMHIFYSKIDRPQVVHTITEEDLGVLQGDDFVSWVRNRPSSLYYRGEYMYSGDKETLLKMIRLGRIK